MSHHGPALVDAAWAQQHLTTRRPLRRGRCRHDQLRAEPHPGRGRLELDQPACRRHPSRHRLARGLQQAPVGARHRPGDDDRPVRRQQQLVRCLGVLAAPALRPAPPPHPRRRSQVLAGQRPAAVDRRAELCGDRHRAPRARLLASRVPRRHPAATGRQRAGPRRRALARRVQRRDHRAPGHERDRPARGPHPRRRDDPVGADRQGGRHVQGRGRPASPVRGQGCDGRQGHHRLLPDRRALVPLVVRPPRAPRL